MFVSNRVFIASEAVERDEVERSGERHARGARGEVVDPLFYGCGGLVAPAARVDGNYLALGLGDKAQLQPARGIREILKRPGPPLLADVEEPDDGLRDDLLVCLELLREDLSPKTRGL